MKLPTRRWLAYVCVPLFTLLAGFSTVSAQTYAFGQAYLSAGKQPMSIASGDERGVDLQRRANRCDMHGFAGFGDLERQHARQQR